MSRLKIAHRFGLPLEAVTQFWSKVDRRGKDECWPWMGGTFANGYGCFWWGRSLLAHRVAFGIENGYMPEVVRHGCDNKPCCNPAHLLGGTVADNVQDRVDRNRSASGLRNGMNTRPEARPAGICHGRAKLTDEQGAEVRERWAAGDRNKAKLAREFGVSHQNIRDIVEGRGRWAHVHV